MPQLRCPIRRSTPATARISARLALCFVALTTCALAASDGLERRGAGGFLVRPLASELGFDAPPPPPAFRVGEASRVAAPTNQWYSTVMFHRWAYPLYAQPLTYRPTEAGFEVGLPSKTVVIEDDGRKRFIRYPHVGAFSLSATGYTPTHSALARHDDWLVTVRLADEAGRGMDATVLHGRRGAESGAPLC